MKHFTTLAIAAAMLASTATAQAQTAPAAEWAKFVTGQLTSGSMTNAIATTEDGSMTYWMGTVATKSAGDQGFYGSEPVFTAAINTERNNNSLVILGINDKGEKVWNGYLKYGDAISNNGGIAILPDKSIAVVAVVRHDPLALDKAIVFVDCNGDEYEVYPAVSEYRNVAIFLHFFDNGYLIESGYINVDAPEIDGTVVHAGITVDGVTATPDGNILVYGNQRANFNVIDKNDANQTISVNNNTISGWNGDAQKEAGNMYLFKMTPGGKTMNNLLGQSTGYTNGHVSNAVYDEAGNLFVYGKYSVIEGASSYDGHFGGGTAFFTKNGVANLFIAKVKTNFTVDWLKNIVGEKVNNSCIVQNSGLAVGNGNLWLAAQYNGKFYPQGDDSKAVQSTQKVREGMLVRFNPETGEWINGVSSYDSFPAAGLTAYQDVLTTSKAADKVYVFGYMMNAATGVFLREYDVETLKANTDNAWSLVTGVKGDGFNAAMPLAFNIAYAPKTGTAYTDARGKGGMCAAGLPTATTGSAFGIQIAKFQLDKDTFGGVADIVVDNDDANAPVEYYDLQGRRLGDTPAAGLYIRRQGSTATKVLVR